MIPVFSPSQIRQVEELSCSEQKISMLELMERAGSAFSEWILKDDRFNHSDFYIFCGNGNNGGDGLVIGRLLHENGRRVHILLVPLALKSSHEYLVNLERFKSLKEYSIQSIEANHIPDLKVESKDIIIDAILGTGNSRPFAPEWTSLINFLNQFSNQIVSVDLPSGCLADNITPWLFIKSKIVFGIEFPKVAYFLPENENHIPEWILGKINLSEKVVLSTPTDFYYLQIQDIKLILNDRKKFSYKNNFGHAAILAGSESMCGACLLSSRACLRAGAGLVSVFTNENCRTLQFEDTPEVMVHLIGNFMDCDWTKFNAILIGPGMVDIPILNQLINKTLEINLPLVIDAEALNFLSLRPEFYKKLPQHSILTPHIGEFERLTGEKSQNSFNRILKARQFAIEYNVILILKGAYTSIHLPDGTTYFNSTGNPGMATAGSGDVLSGIICSLLAQNYSPKEASLISVLLHGLAGDLAIQNETYETLIASDIIANLSKAFKVIRGIL